MQETIINNQTAEKIGNYRWRIVGLLFFATTINYIDRQVIGILKPMIAGDLGWSELDYGYIVSAFQIAYAIGMVVTGWLLDRVGTKIGYAIAIFVWSIAGIGHAFARSAVSFGFMRFFLGIGESANFPAAIKTVAEWFPKKERALATGWFNSGSSVGAIVGPLIVTGIALTMGWQWAFIITGALGFVWLFFWIKLYRNPTKEKRLSPIELKYILSDESKADDDKTSVKKIKWIELFKYKSTYAIISSRLVTDWVWWFFLFWTPDYLNKVYGIDIKEAILPLIVIYSFASLGGIGGGWLSSKLISMGKTVGFARKKAILIAAILVLPLLYISKVDNMWLAVAIISLAAAAHQAWASNIFTIVSDIYPKNAVGSMIGLSGVLGSVMGALAASIIGWVLEVTHSYMLIFTVAGVSYLIAWAILEIFIKKLEPLEIKTS